MSDTSQATPPAGTESNSGTPTQTDTTPPTSSTTPPSQETAKSNGSSEGSTLGTQPKAEGEERSKGEAKGDGQGDKAKPEGPPEKYEFKAPEGYTLDEGLVAEASTIFKEAGLSQAQADKLVGIYNKQIEQNSNHSLQSVRDMRAGWVKELSTSPEYSKEFDASGKIKADSEVLARMGRMLDSLGDRKLASDFRQSLDLTGAGDHPAFFRVMDRLSKHFAEGTSVRGNGPSPHGTDQPSSRRSAAQEMYPKLPSAGA